MFTGIIAEVGIVKGLQPDQGGLVVEVSCPRLADSLKIGDSVAVNGVCLTANRLLPGGFLAEIMPETVRRTNLSHLSLGDRVNLEPALRVGDPLGGHWVTGHIDGQGRLAQKYPQGKALIMEVTVPDGLLAYIVEKGSISLDGASLTVASLTAQGFQVSLVSHTLLNTTLRDRGVGDALNVETDILAKYISKALGRGSQEAPKNELTESFLAQHGFLP